MQQISKQEYEEFFKWLFGENIEIKEEFDISMALYYNDPNIYYTKEIYDLFQTKAMQRLEKITHLGAFVLINPNIYHNRLEHSKGAYRRCIEFLATQYRDNDWKKYIEGNKQKGYLVDTIKFMCTHDIGHFVLSHSMEKFIGDENCSHEDIGEKIRKEDPELKQVLEVIKPNEISSNKGDGSLQSLCEGNIDFDRFDYLSRDVLFTGENEQTDINELINRLNSSCTLEKLDNGQIVYVYNNEAIKDIERFLIYRKEMYEKQYIGSSKSKIEYYLRDILEKCVKEDEDSRLKLMIETVYNKAIDDIDIEKYIDTDDIKLFNNIISKMQETSYEDDKALLGVLLPKPQNALNLALNMLNPKNRNQSEYTEEERQFLKNVRNIINGDIKQDEDFNIDEYILIFESSDEQILNEVDETDGIKKNIIKLKMYNPNKPIYIKDRKGNIVTLQEHPDLQIDLSNENIYRIIISKHKLREQGYTETEIDEIVNKFQKENYQRDTDDTKTRLESEINNKNTMRSFKNFFGEEKDER